MAKNENKNKKTAAATSAESKKRKNPGSGAISNKSKGSGGGMDEFDMLFSDKKKQDQQTKKEEAKEEVARKAAKKARYENDDGGSSSFTRNHSSDTNRKDWVDDGLGGKYNKEGYTGRVEEGIKIFKRHILNKPGAGNSKDCPFDCECCFIWYDLCRARLILISIVP